MGLRRPTWDGSLATVMELRPLTVPVFDLRGEAQYLPNRGLLLHCNNKDLMIHLMLKGFLLAIVIFLA